MSGASETANQEVFAFIRSNLAASEAAHQQVLAYIRFKLETSEATRHAKLAIIRAASVKSLASSKAILSPPKYLVLVLIIPYVSRRPLSNKGSFALFSFEK